MPIRNRFITPIKALLVICTSVLIISCGDVAIYDEHDPKLHGKKIRFNVEMVYIPISEILEPLPDELRKYEYLLSEHSYSLKDHTIAEKIYKTIEPSMNFTIMKSYFNKELNPLRDNSRKIILKDEDGIISVTSITKLKKSNLNQSDYIEYIL